MTTHTIPTRTTNLPTQAQTDALVAALSAGMSSDDYSAADMVYAVLQGVYSRGLADDVVAAIEAIYAVRGTMNLRIRLHGEDRITLRPTHLGRNAVGADFILSRGQVCLRQHGYRNDAPFAAYAYVG